MARLLVISLLFVLAFSTTSHAKRDSWSYQAREEGGITFKEGTKGSPVSGHDLGVELVAFEAEYDRYDPKQSSQTNKAIPVRFCIPPSGETQGEIPKVNLTIRELEDIEHYLLNDVGYGGDKPRSAIRWEPGCSNLFPWVVTRAKAIVGDLHDLGTLVILETKRPSSEPVAAPTFLHQNCVDSRIQGYKFVLRTSRAAEIEAKVLKDGQAIPLQPFPARTRGGKPITLRWKPTDMSEGWYTLDIQGVKESIGLRVKLYHKNMCPQ